MKDEDPNIREAIPEGLLRLVRQNERPDIATRALDGLEEARMDPNADVRREVELALERV